MNTTASLRLITARTLGLAALLAAVAGYAPGVARAQYYWTGTQAPANDNISQGANWQGGYPPPVTGSASVVFSNQYAGQNSAAYFVNLDMNFLVYMLTFNGGTGFMLSSTNNRGLDIGGGGIHQSGVATQTISVPTFLTANQTWTYDKGSGPLTFNSASASGQVINQGYDLTLAPSNTATDYTDTTFTIYPDGDPDLGSRYAHVFAVSSADAQVLNGNISGSGGLTVNGTGFIVLTGTNTYQGETTVSAGTLEIGRASGTATGGSVINASAVTVDSVGSQPASVYVTGTGVLNTFIGNIGFSSTGSVTQNGGTVSFANLILGEEDGSSGHYTLGVEQTNASGFGPSEADTPLANSQLTTETASIGAYGVGRFTQMSGVYIAGTFGLNIGTSGTYDLYGGTLATVGVTGGGGSSTFNFIGGTVQATANITSLFSGVTHVYMGVPIAAATPDGGVGFSRPSSAYIDTNAYNVTIPASLSRSPTTAGDTYPTGSIDGGLVKLGSGTLTLTASNTYGGPTMVNAGTLLIDGNNSGKGEVTVNGSGSSLGGTGTVAGLVTVASGGTLNPGNNSGANGSTANVGTLHAGTLTGNNGAALAFDVNSATLYDQLVVSGNASLGGATLTVNVDSNASFISGQTLDLIHLTNGTLGGTFAGISNDGFYTFGKQSFEAIYTGTDFDLVVVPEPATWLAGMMTALLGASAYRRRARQARRSR